MIIWLIGISGAGKTTIGRKLETHFKGIGKKCYLLDGDEVRDLFDRDLGYSDKDREANIKRIILGAYLLDRNDIIGIICNIGPLEDLRQLARRKITGYNEIYLKKDMRISIKNDVKGVYRENIGRTQIVGIDATFDEPQMPDLVLEVDKMTIEESYQAVIQYIVNKYGSDYAGQEDSDEHTDIN
ncbi:MAG: adenylyl-sulfate kinase [Ruminococcus flavefaciens]|nr:adenylyl-sulfate kinase [Ruminococcus flavefaciens]